MWYRTRGLRTQKNLEKLVSLLFRENLINSTWYGGLILCFMETHNVLMLRVFE